MRSFVYSLALGVALAVPAFAQSNDSMNKNNQPNQNQPGINNGAGGTTQQVGNIDPVQILKFHEGCRFNVALAELAQKNAQDPQVKQFADKIVSSYDGDKKLEQILEKKNLIGMTGAGVQHQTVPSTRGNTTTPGQMGLNIALPPEDAFWQRLRSEYGPRMGGVGTLPAGVPNEGKPGTSGSMGTTTDQSKVGETPEARECYQKIEQLQMLKGHDFDVQYVKFVAEKSEKAIEHVKTLEGQVTDPEVKQIFTDAIPKIEKEHQDARQLEKTLLNEKSTTPRYGK
jgi:uncharacterized protein (DUF305 family)